MERLRTALAVLCTEGVTPSDWRVLAGTDAAEVAADLRAQGPLLAHLLGKSVGPTDWARVDSQLELAARAGAAGVTIWDAAYPARLGATPLAPPLLFARGNLDALSVASLAIVGTRAPSAAGIAFSRRLARAMTASGICIVSGLARGIDTAAHRGALDGGGRTVAVLGTGIDVAYPPENAGLMETIAQAGCVVSEQMCGTRGAAHVFPRRNRIISGLSEAVVVVEGGARSGALITARWALEQGRDVGAVPGFPGDFRSAGPNSLLRDGAFLVEDATDVIMSVPALRAAASGRPGERDAEEGKRHSPGGDAAGVLALLATDASADEIAEATGLDAARVQEILSRMEIEGRVVRDGLGRFIRAPR
ncbi:MAG TPA: DNA-processing protein DprA [Candidatus Krumholzibacteria bacterium]|nr:DNA-processing protein DprA [Candidatus Krumholzibacteria bacterium]